jgi:hypothetical protein
MEKFGGPPETRTPDPLIKSPTPAKLQPTPAYCSEEKQKFPLVALVAVRTERTDTKRTQTKKSNFHSESVSLDQIDVLFNSVSHLARAACRYIGNIQTRYIGMNENVC